MATAQLIARRFLAWRWNELAPAFRKRVYSIFIFLIASAGLGYAACYLYHLATAAPSRGGRFPQPIFDYERQMLIWGVVLLATACFGYWRLLSAVSFLKRAILVCALILLPGVVEFLGLPFGREINLVLALLYLFSLSVVILILSKDLILVTTLISVGGVAVGVAALITVIGVIDGIDDMIFGSISRLSPHVRIRGPEGGPLKIDNALLERLRANPQVELAQPVIQKEAVLQNTATDPPLREFVTLIGMDEIGPGTLYPDLGNRLTGGTIRMPDGYILVGTPLYYRLRMRQGEPVQILSTTPVRTALGATLRAPRREIVYGSFSTRMPDILDAHTAFVSTAEIREFARMDPGTVDYIHVKLNDPYAADAFKRELKLPEAQYRVITWNEENGEFFGALKLERLGLWLILLLIVLVAALNIVGTLILMVIEKTREVGILRAIGASERLIARVFLMDGVMIGLLGTIIGATIGIIACLLIPMIDLGLPGAIFNNLPVKIRPATVLMVVGASMSICTLAGLFPARQAAKLNPVEALRYD